MSDCHCAVQDYITKAVRECPVPGGRVWAEPPGPVPTPGRDLPRKGGRGGHDGEELSPDEVAELRGTADPLLRALWSRG